MTPGADTIAFHLRQQLGQQVGCVPSVATSWRVLSRRGFVTPQPHKRPRSSWRRFQAELPNECWQADITHWQLTDRLDAKTEVQTEVEILNIIDDHSRLLTGTTTRPVFKASAQRLRHHLRRPHYPERELTDTKIGSTVYRALAHFRWWLSEEDAVA